MCVSVLQADLNANSVSLSRTRVTLWLKDRSKVPLQVLLRIPGNHLKSWQARRSAFILGSWEHLLCNGEVLQTLKRRERTSSEK